MFNLLNLFAIQVSPKKFQYNYGAQAKTVAYIYETANAVPSSVLVDDIIGTNDND